MEGLTFNYGSSRAAKAKIAAAFDNKWLRRFLWVIAMTSALGWFWFLIVSPSMLAHAFALLLGLSIVPLFWYHGELKDLKPDKDSFGATDVASVLERQLLSRINKTTTPKDLAGYLSTSSGGYFFAARFAISAELLKPSLSDSPEDMLSIWSDALKLAESSGDKELSSASVMAALVRSLPDHESYLAFLHLDDEDLLAGLKWYVHLQHLMEQFKQKNSYGGIGRDLSFGWAPLLNRIGVNITGGIQTGGILHRSVPSHDQIIDQMMHVLSQPGRRNAALVGEVGVGKTTLVYAMAARMLENPKAVPVNLRYNQIISLDPSHLIANAQGRGELEQLLIHLFNEAIRTKNVILFLDNAELFLKDGTGSVDLSSVLLPILEGGSLRVIVSLNDQEWLRLSQVNPGLAQLLNRIVVRPLDAKESMQVMEDQVLLLESQHHIVYMYNSLKEGYKLADRYIREQAFPGKAIKLLEAAAGFTEQEHFVTVKSVQQAVEKSFDVKVQTASTVEEKDLLINLEERIHKRMVNQSRAVKLVSDALRRARAGVRNESRPIGTFLFLGPTGVGKTELSKALADIYFGGEDRLVRIDLNEYSQPTDTTRLLAIGATDPYSLCAQIIKQPFSVVLMDEIEKAHPNVLNMLLQLLDEGILRDAENKPVSFRDAIIVATSNAGADKIRTHIEQGEALEQFEEAFVNELIESNIFRPEFLNRFDEIVLFRPLTQEELRQVVDLLIAALNKRLGAQKIAVELTDAAKQLLIEAGYDARLGARPLRRTVQRAVENLVAQRMLNDQAHSGQTIQIDSPELQALLNDRT